LPADKESLICLGTDKMLGVCIDSDELCPMDTFFHHAGYGIRSPATASDDRDLSLELGQDLVKVFVILRN
jgi:hypothetical protein